MEFEFIGYVWIDDCELDTIARRVALGEDFEYVYNLIASGWEDEEYYNNDRFKESVKKEVMRRVASLR